ncbi:unnamed protein product [Diatraea saccharalis]|uniref:BTB domain-containing protein n=1 Tax=Diatraea saccharalis TaxID=40085 RepID=A0A9P0C7H8_9NEOP|nr:unnamed protein product [Diatraea saccharalis]
MVQSQFSITWESYNSNICKGFSSLQQNGEFVDMTIAADGYYVKVHQVLIALASPFLKDLISSAPCQHPVLFLNNVSHRTLSALLEYIYTGEVLVAADNLASFTEAAKSLHIKGLENFTGNDSKIVKLTAQPSQIEDDKLCHISGIKRPPQAVNQQTPQIELPSAARKICIKQEPKQTPNKKSEAQPPNFISNVNKIESHEFDEQMDDSIDHDDNDSDQQDRLLSEQKDADSTVKPVTNLQFTVSIRGSLQIILNRYIYNMHSITHRNGVRRWRCVDYRNHKCKAFVVTRGNVVLNRANLHNHSFHDKKILGKIEKKCVYSALDDVQGYNKEKDESKITEHDDFMSFEEFPDDIGDKSDDFMKED